MSQMTLLWVFIGAGLATFLIRLSFIAVEGRVLTQLEDHELYFYAESTDGTFSWEGGTFVNFNGTRYPMRKATTVVERGNLVLILNCNKGTEL